MQTRILLLLLSAAIMAMDLCHGETADDREYWVGVTASAPKQLRAAEKYLLDGAQTRLVDINAGDPAVLRKCAFIVVNREAMPDAMLQAFDDYVRNGGTAVFMGRAALRPVTADLCGVRIMAKKGTCSFLRVRVYAPLLMGFPVDQPVELPDEQTTAVLALPAGAQTLASAGFQPEFVLRTGEKIYSWVAATRLVGEGVYLSVQPRGRGYAVFVAEDLLERPVSGARAALLSRILSPLTLTILRQGSPYQPPLTDENGNWIFNGNMETILLVRAPPAGSPQTGGIPYPVPARWTHNNWGGSYKVHAGVESNGNHFLRAEVVGQAGDAVNANCVLRYQHFLGILQCGRNYKMKFRVHGNREIRVSLWGRLEKGKGWKYAVKSATPSPEKWQEYECTFRIPRMAFKGRESTAGFFLDFSSGGGGWMEVDDIELREAGSPASRPTK